MKLLNRICSKVLCFKAGTKKESGDHLIQILGTILIAIILLVLFRDKLQALFSDFLQKITEAMEGLFKGGSTSGTGA